MKIISKKINKISEKSRIKSVNKPIASNYLLESFYFYLKFFILSVIIVEILYMF